MAFKTIFGWLLLLVGVAIIFYGLYSSFNIFTGASPVPEIFSFEKEAVQPAGEKALDIQTQLEQMMGRQLMEMLPVGFLSTILNLVAWSIFVGILIFAGSHLAGLGIKLLL